jgi:phage major head subunit gpT-like protein
MNTSANFAILLEPRLRKVFFEGYDELPEQFSKVFKVNTSKKAKESDYHVAGLGLWPEKESAGPIQYEDINPGLEVNYVHKEYAKGTQVERKFVDDEMYGVIEKVPRSHGRGGRATVETVAASVLNDAFTKNGYDGVPLISANHPLFGNNGGTCSNLVSGNPAVSSDAIKNALILARNTVDDAQLKIQCKPSYIVIPEDLEFTVGVILKSAQEPGTADNNTNVLRGKLEPIVLDYLTSATAWFLLDKRFENLNFFWRVKPEYKREENFDTMVAKYRGYMRFSAGYSDWRGIVGSNGSGV